MHFQKKLGLGFIVSGLVIILLAYLITHSGAFVFSALIGVMAICFGAFQVALSNLAMQAKKPNRGAPKVKKHR